MTFGFLVGSRNFISSSASPEKFLFYMGRIRFIELPKLFFHDSVSMIVSRFTSFTEVFVICSYQVPNFSDLGTTVPARLLQEDIVIFVFKQISQFGSFGK